MSVETANGVVANRLALGGATRIVSAYLRHHDVPAGKVPELIRLVHASLSGLGGEIALNGAKPAVPVAKSVTPDFLICLEDGRRLKVLRRYLRAVHNMSPEEYRAKWSLPANYPMVAPNYGKSRSEFAKRIGLGKRAKPGRAAKERGGASA